MMSHYGLPYEFDDHWICGSLELSIETLTGTAFEIKVSPNDTIMSIKSKIQNVEGIPVSQQHLLYNLEELDNSASVRDYSIQNGATLKLVLSMRVGPISTKRLPPVDEIAWRDLQELISDTHRDDLFERLPSGSKVTVLIFRDGEQVNLLRVVENEDGSFSDSWNGTSVWNLFSEQDPEESAKRLQENSVTMGKVQELKERLETLSIQRKEKKCDESCSGESSKPEMGREAVCKRENAKCLNLVSYPASDMAGHSSSLKLVRRSETDLDDQETFRPQRRLLSYSKIAMAGLNKARKEAQNIIQMQSKLSVFVDSEPSHRFVYKRPPLPEIRRSDKEEKKQDEKLSKSLRGKTASFAIVEEENDVASASSICSSQSSVVALPSSDEVAAEIAFSPMSRERTVGRSRYKVSRYVLENDERPKTTPGKMDGRRESKNEQYCNVLTERETSSKRTNHILSTISNILPRAKAEEGETDAEETRKRASTNIRNPSFRDETPKPVAAQKLPAPLTKKRLRCSQCKKKLNITNTYNCRCGGVFCSVHRYSEVHNCPFDYKEEGRKLLQQMNPLIAASKLPKI